MIPLRLIGAGAGLVAVCALVWMLRESAYRAGVAAGKADSQAFYRPILEEVERRAHEAQGRIQAMEKASKAIDSEMERQHAQFQTALAERERAAQQRIARIVRESAARCDSRTVSPPAGPTEPPHGTPEEFERDRAVGERLALDIVTIGSGCERDAATVGAWQQWYRQQAALRE